MAHRISVRIKLVSTWDDERIEQDYRGELYRRGSAIYVRYTEQDEQGGKTRTVVKLSEREIKIMRRGEIESEQTFVLHHKRKGHHRTPAGTLPIVTDTRSMRLEQQNGRWTAAWSYILYVADEPAGNFNLKLNIQEEAI